MLISRFPPHIGGTEIQCFRLSRALVSRGHEVRVLTEGSSGQPAESVVDGVRIRRFCVVGKPPFSSFLYAMKCLAYLVTHRNVDVLHAHMIATPAVVAIGAGSVLRIPVLVKVAGARQTGDIGTSRRLMRGRLKLWLFKKLARFVVCPSDETIQELKALGLPDDRLHKIPNGVDISRFSPEEEGSRIALRERLGLPADRLIAVYAGRWAEGKGVETLLGIWRDGLNRPSWRWDLLLLVSEPLSQGQREQLKTLNGHAHMQFKIEDPAPYFKTSDLAVLLSKGEGISNFLLEAMACGLPTLTSETAALSKSPERMDWGFVVDDSHQALAVLEQLERNAELGAEKGARARKKIEQEFSIDEVAQGYETLYKRMIGPRII